MAAKFRIDNATRYSGRDLSTLVRALVRDLGDSSVGRRLYSATIHVVTYHPRKAHASAEIVPRGLRGDKRTIKLCPPEKLWTNAVDALAAQTSERDVPLAAFLEICECVYFAVTGHQRSYRTGPVPEWAQGKRVRVLPPPEPEEKLVGLDYHRNKLEHEEAKLAEWEAKLARAQKKAKAWRKKVRSRKGVIRRLKRDQGA